MQRRPLKFVACALRNFDFSNLLVWMGIPWKGISESSPSYSLLVIIHVSVLIRYIGTRIADLQSAAASQLLLRSAGGSTGTWGCAYTRSLPARA